MTDNHSIRIDRKHMPSPTIAARTLCVENPSNRISKKSGFVYTGDIVMSEDGKAWGWNPRP